MKSLMSCVAATLDQIQSPKTVQPLPTPFTMRRPGRHTVISPWSNQEHRDTAAGSRRRLPKNRPPERQNGRSPKHGASSPGSRRLAAKMRSLLQRGPLKAVTNARAAYLRPQENYPLRHQQGHRVRRVPTLAHESGGHDMAVLS